MAPPLLEPPPLELLVDPPLPLELLVDPPPLELLPEPPLELLVDPPLLELLLELLDPPLELPLLPDPPAGVHPGAWPADSNMPLPSAIYQLQSGNVTLPSTMVNVDPL
ncbi:MAG: hypothetical protein WCP29_18285 [Acidobacteriota bacterium]